MRRIWLQLQFSGGSGEWVVGIDVMTVKSMNVKSRLAAIGRRILGIIERVSDLMSGDRFLRSLDVTKGTRGRDVMRLFAPTPYVSHELSRGVQESRMRSRAQSLARLIGVPLVEKPEVDFGDPEIG